MDKLVTIVVECSEIGIEFTSLYYKRVNLTYFEKREKNPEYKHDFYYSIRPSGEMCPMILKLHVLELILLYSLWTLWMWICILSSLIVLNR